MTKNNNPEYNKGLALSIACYVMWGAFPLYWRLLKDVPSLFILGNRVLWSAVFLTAFCIIKNRKAFWQVISNKQNIGYMALAGSLITINWGTFIYAVNNGYLLESSLGYYINPLVNILLGVVFFKEKLNIYEKISALLALSGVCFLTFSYGSFPIISIILALTFGFYGIIKKKAALPVAPALALENIIIAPLVIVYFIWMYSANPEALSSLNALQYMLLILGGLVTAIPLLLFAKAVKILPYSTLGFIQYVGPTLQLIIAIFIFNENFTTAHWICFGLIWAGLAVFTTNLIRQNIKGAQ